MRIALGAKLKLGFFKGTISMSNMDFKLYYQWKRCDYMVISSILNLISKDLAPLPKIYGLGKAMDI